MVYIYICHGTTSPVAREELLEREDELHVLQTLVAQALGGDGRVLPKQVRAQRLSVPLSLGNGLAQVIRLLSSFLDQVGTGGRFCPAG
jgi:hypothetical protein